MSSASPPDAPQPRLCHVKKWSDFNGYGFNLHAEKNKHGHHIGALDAGSPAEAAGLKEGDRIVEVNGTNIANENHQQVVSRIRAVNNEVKLLVVDPPADEYYRERRVVVRGDMAGVVAITTPPTMAAFQADPRAGYAEGAAGTTDESDPAPRLAKLRTWLDFQGYGFNLTSEKSKSGQYIGKVDTDSPADTANVREGDRIIEVNGVNVTEETHHQVVSRIKARPGQVDLLLVDKETDSFYSSRGTVIRGDMPQVVVAETPERGKVGVPRPRLYHLKKWPNFPGYGFNLHERLKQPGHLIGSVDADSPAEATGMRIDDKIIEVNGRIMLECSHHQVVDRIRQFSDRVSLLVVDATTDKYYRDQSIWIHSKMADIEEIECPSSNDKAPRPRLFHMRKWPDFPGYGFDLHEEKSRPGHLIGSVDIGSPAAMVKLRRDDKIIEVNGHNVLEESHKRVVERITEKDDEVKLLVVDSVAEQYYNDNSIWVHGRMDNIDSIECPTQNPAGMIVNDTAVGVDTVNIAIVNGSAPVNGHSIQYAPRLCHLTLLPNYQGYGFDLQNEKGRVGHLIGKIDEGSPASRSNLQEGDKVVEVNGKNVEEITHANVVARIQEGGNTLKLLVIDEEASQYFLNNEIQVREHLVQKKQNGDFSEDAQDHVMAVSTDSSPTHPALSRLCHLQTRSASEGYGFELHRRENQTGHFIGPIDADSPSEVAGLHKGDEIIDIQGTNVQSMSHDEVVQLLRNNPKRVTLLVTNSQPLVPYSPPSVNMTNSAVELRHSTPHARHCYLKKWSDFEGYGFDLYEIRKNPGPRVGVISPSSPAEATRCKQDDFIIEVNGENVEKFRHPEVVKKVGHDPTVVRMLLVDQEAKAYFKAKSIRIHSDMDNVETIYCPDNRTVVAVTSGPRRIQLKIQPGFNGFGFDLQERDNVTGHYIGSVDSGSLAAAAGLERDDQVVEVNGKTVVNDTHEEVVDKIRANPNEVNLLVVSAGSSTVYHSNALWVNTGNRDTVIMVPREDHKPSVATTAAVVDAGNTTVISPNAPRPRLCKLQRWADFAGYGFDLHEERNRVGHLIGSVDPGSPADVAGLKKEDQIIEVNAHNVLEGTHHEVVDHIKQYEDHVDMLVVDSDAKDYYEDNSIWVHSKMANVQIIECPRRSSEAADIPIPVPLVAATVNSHAPEADAPPMRMCHLKKWHDFQGYGFNLHDEKGVAGHFVGKVDVESPAESAGLRVKDKIIEVNGEPVNEDDHHQVVQRVTSDPSGVSLLVADAAANDYFRAHNLRPHGQMANITVITCPAHRAQSIVQESPVSLEQSEPEPEHHRSSAAVTTSTVAMASVISNGVDHHPPASLRLCTVNKWVEYDGYGFNLHDEQGRPGHFIGSVEPGSPAESTGLRKGDQIYEVNGATVQTADHHVVIQHVLENPDQVQMLVGQPDVGQYYLEHEHQWPHSLMASVERNVGSKHSPARVSVTTSAAAPKPEPTIRLCHLRKWTTYEGYGFRLHDDKKKPGHFIGPLEPGSPADLAGLAKGDRVVEVNGVSCKDMDHHQVVSCITANPGEVRLLVLSVDANAYYTKLGTWPHGAMPNVSRIECPNMQPGAATNGVPEAKVDEIDVVEHNGHAYVQPDRHLAREPSPEPAPPTPEVVYRAPTPEPIRVPTPEPVRAPTPEPVPVALVEVARVPTPEPVREPSLEPVRQPSPAPVRQPSPVREVNGVVESVVVTTVMSEMKNESEIKIDEPLYDVADPVVMTEEIETNRIFIVPPPPPLPEEMNGSHVVTTETEVSHMESNVVRPDHESVVTVGHIAPVAAVGVAADKLSIASSVATSEASSTAEAGYNLEEAEITAETSEVARHMESEDVTGTGAQLAYEHMPMSVAKSSSNEAVYQNVEPVVEQGIFTTVISVSSDPTIAEVPRPSVEPVAVSSEHVVATHHSESCTVTTEMNEVVMRSLRSLTDNGHVDEVSVLETSTQPLPEFNDALNMASSKRSSTSTISDSVTHYAFTEEADELAMGGDVAESHVTENPLAVDITESHFIEIDARPTKFHISESHVTEDEVAGGLVTERQVTDHQATESHITRSHVTESHVTKGVAVNEFMSPDEPTVVQITTTTSYSYSKPVVDEPDSPAPTPATGADPMAGSLQDVLSRVKSRKKPQARTGNLSMKEKFELFQQL